MNGSADPEQEWAAMAEIDYLNFDLQIERVGEGYRAHVLDSPAGQASNDFALPFSDLELENFVLRMSRTRRVGSPPGKSGIGGRPGVRRPAF